VNEAPGALWRAIIEYDGTDYYGFQVQENVPTIQGSIEKVLEKFSGQHVRVVGAGRTDAGVHASGQVISFPLEWRGDAEELQRAMNAVLPDDIVVLVLEEAPPGFHPRFSATSRTYEYRILNTRLRSPLRARYSAHVGQPLDVESMQKASDVLVGRHDFRSFGQPPQGDNSVRTIFEAHWDRKGEFLVFRVKADAFLRKMVRRIVGTLLKVGLGISSPEEMVRLVDEPDPALAGPPAPPQGLCLVKVDYPPELAFASVGKEEW
jgi:tRNA pseudouridine38-40 synthase